MEREPELGQLREKMALAFCASSISWHLPTQSWRGPGIQQYHPSEFKKIPPEANKPGEKTYNTTKIKDNFWLTPKDNPSLFWIFDGVPDLWTRELLKHLDSCLDRMTYFGRAESITSIARVQNSDIVANCVLRESRTASAVPVLCPTVDATLAQVACMTNEAGVADATTPPGAVWKYAERPTVKKYNTQKISAKTLSPTSMLQFAIGGRVFPPLKVWLRITERFRGAVLRNIAQQRTGNPKAKFSDLPNDVRSEYSLLTGKDANGERLSGHRHTAFFLIPDNMGNPSRLICYRKEPFTSEEQVAMLTASAASLAWDYADNSWRLRLIPLPTETPLPPDKNVFGESRVWETLVPYVPPLHVYRKNGKPKIGSEVEKQILDHLFKRGLPSAEPIILQSPNESVQWMKVHRPKRNRSGPTNDDKRAYQVRLTFSNAIQGPLFLGHSSHFGLGLFAPADEQDQ
jgi:CRISPR-associated protein Csb2